MGAGGGVQGQCGCGRERSPGPGRGWCQRLCLCPLAATSRKDRGSPVVLQGPESPVGGDLVGLHLVWRPCPCQPRITHLGPGKRAPALDLLADEPAE